MLPSQINEWTIGQDLKPDSWRTGKKSIHLGMCILNYSNWTNKSQHEKKWSSIIKYTKWFKELIRKAGISDVNAIYQYSQGLTPAEYRNITLTNPTNLQGWYDAAHWLYNIDSHLASFSNNAQSEWDMDVDAILVNALSREERDVNYVENASKCCCNSLQVL